MASFNLKTFNFFFSQIVQYFVSWQGELEQSAVFTCRIYTVFLSISTLYTRRHWLKKKKKGLVQIRCTTTSREMDTYSAMLYSNLYNPPLRFGCWVVYKSKTGLFIQSSIVRISFMSCWQFPPAAARHSLCNLTMFLRKQNKNLLQ